MQNNFKNFTLSILLILVCVSRLIPHPFNFSPVASIFLMAPLLFNDKKWSLIISFIPLIVSDILIGKFLYHSDSLIYDGFIWVYFSYIMIWLFSYKIGNSKGFIINNLSASLIFFLITNAACWINNPMYSQNVFGLFECYVAGIPFYWNTLSGIIFYSSIIYLLEKSTNKFFAFD